MINGDINEFLNCLNFGEELDIIYNNETFLIEGYYTDDKIAHLVVLKYQSGIEEVHEIVYEITSSNIKECADKFIKAKIWNGKSFWEIEPNIEWI